MKKILIALMMLPALLCEATTYYVSLTGNDSANGTTPETAFLTPSVANSKAKEGDTIVLCKGTWKVSTTETWKGGLEVASGVTLRGETDDPRDTIVDAQGKCAAIVFRGIGSTVSSLTVSNGYTSTQYWGGGVTMGNAKVPDPDGKINLVTNCVITCCSHGHNTDQTSLQVDAKGRVVDCVVSFNTNKVTGAAVSLYDGGEIINSIVENNVGYSGAGIVGVVKTSNAASMLVKGCTIRNNKATNMGAGILNVTTVRDCLVEENEATTAGGGLFYRSGFNSAFSSSSFVTVSNTVIRANRVTSSNSYGGGLAWTEYAAITNFIVDSCIFSNNTSAASAAITSCVGGGAIYMRPNKIGGLVVLRNSLFTANKQLETDKYRGGAAVWLDGGVAASTVGGVIRIENCTFAANRNYSASTTSLYLGDKQLVFVTNTVVVANLDASGTPCPAIEGGSGNWRYNWAYSYIYPAYNGGSFADKTVINGTSEPKFEEGTWIPSIHSPFRDAGLTLDWMNGAYDLQRDENGGAFRKRVLGKSVDMGCFEYLPLGLTILVK